METPARFSSSLLEILLLISLLLTSSLFLPCQARSNVEVFFVPTLPLVFEIPPYYAGNQTLTKNPEPGRRYLQFVAPLVDDCDATYRFLSGTLVDLPCVLVELGLKEITWF